MKTEITNITSDMEGGDNKNGKKSKVGSVAGKTAAFAAAAGVGVAGTMAAQAMDSPEEEMDEEVVEGGTPHPHASEQHNGHSVSEPEEFNPNDIRLDDIEEAVIDDDKIVVEAESHGSDELEPITEESVMDGDVAMVDVDNTLTESEIDDIASIDITPEDHDDSGMWDNFDEPDSFIADNGLSSEPDIMDDIINS